MSKLFDPARVTPLGREYGENLVRLVEPEIARLAADGEPDARCATCALRAGTIPNGCVQTLADLTKCIFEQEPFHCHHDNDRVGNPTKVCHGWLAAIVYRVGSPIKLPWAFSHERVAMQDVER